MSIMLPIQKKQIQYNFTPMIGRKIDYIIIHDVGAVSSAIANFNYFNTGNRNASADFFVDPSNIIQANDYTKNFSWQCGDGHGVYGITNANSIGIEMCLIEPFYSKPFSL
jgi:N-acetylmuramoyl-L-alanine amidase CwlA